MGLEEILQWISQGRKSGTLVLMDGDTERRLVFDSGALVGVEARTTLDGVETPSESLRSIQTTAEQVIAELLRWPNGDFRFLDGQRPADLPPGLSIEATRLLLLSAGRVDQRMAARRENLPQDFDTGPLQTSDLRIPSIDTSAAVTPPALRQEPTFDQERANRATPKAQPSSTYLVEPNRRPRVPISKIGEGRVARPRRPIDRTATLRIATDTNPTIDPLALESLEVPNLDVLDSVKPDPIDGSRSFAVRQPPKRSFAVLALGLTALAAAIVVLATGHRQESARPATVAGMQTREVAPRTASTLAPESSRQERKIETFATLSPTEMTAENSRESSRESKVAATTADDLPPIPAAATAANPTDPRDIPADALEPARVAELDSATELSGSPTGTVASLAAAPVPFSAMPDEVPPLRIASYGPEEAGYRIAPAGQSYEIAPADLSGGGSLIRSATAASIMPPPLSDITEATTAEENGPDLPQGSAAEGAAQGGQNQGESQLLEPGADVTSPVLLENTVPAYPAQAPPTNEKTLVDVQVLVGDNGRPESVLLASEPAGSGFDEAAMNAARLTLWQPARDPSGTIGRMWVTVRYRFAARPSNLYDGP